MVDENKQPIQVLIGTLTKTVENLNKLTNAQLFQSMPNEINQSLKELQQTLQTIQNLTQSYNNDSQFSLELSATLKEVSLAAESIERVSRKLEKKPNALLLGDD
jgi:paraquat-inducible protein B